MAFLPYANAIIISIAGAASMVFLANNRDFMFVGLNSYKIRQGLLIAYWMVPTVMSAVVFADEIGKITSRGDNSFYSIFTCNYVGLIVGLISGAMFWFVSAIILEICKNMYAALLTQCRGQMEAVSTSTGTST